MLHPMIRLLALIAVMALVSPVRSDETSRPQNGPYYSGQLLVAGPSMPDPRFAGVVIYLADHDREGAIGLVVNQPLGGGPVRDFLIGLGHPPADDDDISGDIRIHRGGPVDRGAGFVLHTNDYQTENTAMIRGAVAVTASLDAVKDIGRGKGPRRYLILLGYAGWRGGQLEEELRRGDWEIAPYDEETVFGTDDDAKWSRAHANAGVPM